ncbi:MAG: NAD(P)-dependent dehydrogenase (short-subunit alcohol dehydrogenase family) [Psychroserpens sp.]|jgi:gluconate 5-dehydrogenase
MVYTFDLKDKIILVTGGYGHLGKAIVESLAFHNAKVYVLARNEHKYKKAFKDSKFQHNIAFISCDIEKHESFEIAFEEIFQIERKIDVLVNNAYFMKGQSPELMSNEDFNYGIDGTLNCVFRAIKAIIPYFKKSKSGKIINLASMYGIVAPQFEVYEETPQFLNPPHYGAAKAGIIQLTKYYASYLGKSNINVNCVAPGPFPSLEVQKSKVFIEQLEKKTSLNRIGKPEDLGGVFVFLASDSSNYITGQQFVVDGGWTTR